MRQWRDAQWADLFLRVPSCPEPSGVPRGGGTGGAELGRCQGGTLTVRPLLRRVDDAGDDDGDVVRPAAAPADVVVFGEDSEGRVDLVVEGELLREIAMSARLQPGAVEIASRVVRWCRCQDRTVRSWDSKTA